MSARIFLCCTRVLGNLSVRAYALNNEREYFAELTEAFFGRNDYYPFVATDLAEYDPQGYAVLRQVWGFYPATPCSGM